MHTSPSYAYSGAMRSGALPLMVQYAVVAGYQVCAGSLNGRETRTRPFRLTYATAQPAEDIVRGPPRLVRPSRGP